MGERAAKVAVASKQGVAVDEHFGHARRFWIYAVTDNVYFNRAMPPMLSAT